MKARAMQHHYHGNLANTVILFPFSTLAGTFSPRDRDKAHFHQEKGIRARVGGVGEGEQIQYLYFLSFALPSISFI